jgi:hypothetical protein
MTKAGVNHHKNCKVALRRAGSIAMLATALCCAGGFEASAQSPAPPEHLSWYGDPGAPNLSGVWIREQAKDDVGAPGSGGKSKEGWQPWPPPLKGAFAAVWKKRLADAAAGKRTDDPVRVCLPAGMPRYMTGSNLPLLIIQTPGRVTLYRDGNPVRRIWLDRRVLPKPADLEDFYDGNAIGHYEGVDLVTEIAGIKDEPIDSTGVPHSEKLRITERFHRVDDATLSVRITLTDPLAYSHTLTSVVTYKALSDPLWEPREFICKPEVDYHPEAYVR